jgi:D-galactose 1-dehydrogenase
MTRSLKLGLVGYGKIARDQHLPAIAGTDGLDLVAVASRNAQAPGVNNFSHLGDLLESEAELDGIVLCQPPQVRFAAAHAALSAGKHVFLEKPPGASLSEVEALIEVARAHNLTLFASWHSREAAGIARAKDLLREAEIRSVSIAWKEDVRVWHPRQLWIWEPGGFGVFDPGINALSILTEIMPEPVRLVGADLAVPANRAAPIAANLLMETTRGAPVTAEFDFRQSGPQSWDIQVETANGLVLLQHGGNTLSFAGQPLAVDAEQEYPRLYRRFRDLIHANQSAVDLAPLRLVADAFMTGRIQIVEPFDD